ncbi:MAG: phosphotransferase [Acidimicrobiales bacterium]|nr:phosphotransferase [Acidimicrobiales bacterium]
MTIAADVIDLLTRVTGRTPLGDHDGRSGATLERGLLDDHHPVVIKTVVPERDLTFALGNDPTGRERRLWANGVLDELPAGTGHAVIAADWVDERLVTVMRDLGDSVLSWNRALSPSDLDRLLGALAAVHHHFADQAPGGLCDLRTRVSLFAPDRLQPLAATHQLARAVLEGWQHFIDLVPAEIAGAVLSALEHPDPLAEVLGSGTTTMCHGDAWLVNIAITPGDVVLLDWNLATRGPASIDLIDFAVGCASHVDLPIDAILASARDACRDLVDDTVWNATMFWALCELGWNKALDATTHPDETQRARARHELTWWTAQAYPALDAERTQHTKERR